MRLPKDISGRKLAGLLATRGYEVTRQSVSHVRLTSSFKGSVHHVTIPDHNPVKSGTLNGILKDVAEYLEIDKRALMQELFK